MHYCPPGHFWSGVSFCAHTEALIDGLLHPDQRELIG